MTDDLEDCKKENKLLREQLDLCIDMGKLITKKLDKIKWKHIHTAPKDGTFILVWFEEAQHHFILWWFADNWRFKGSNNIPIVDPTHWMPLPEPPK
jgi:hypothetical protein